MDKKRHGPTVWRWEKGDVDKREEHIKVGYGGFGEPFVPMALVAPGEGNCFIVQFLMKKDDIDPAKQENYEELIKELNFFLVESGEEKLWLYLKRYCGTASNMYSTIRWAYYPKGWMDQQNLFDEKDQNQ